ncbi:MAG: YidH family protein [Candidatus Dormibacteraceae bacterium]
MPNTRTLLAWIRTGVALIGLGFVVARFGLFLRALDSQAGRTLILVGFLAVGLGLRRFWPTGRSIEIGRFEVDTSVEVVISVATTIAGLALATYLVVAR